MDFIVTGEFGNRLLSLNRLQGHPRFEIVVVGTPFSQLYLLCYCKEIHLKLRLLLARINKTIIVFPSVEFYVRLTIC